MSPAVEHWATPRRRTPLADRGGLYRPSTLPLGWRTRVDPESVLVHIFVPGTPVPKGRPQFNHTTGTAYTPKRTRAATADLAMILRQANVWTDPVPGPVGALLWFRMPTDSGTDVDNLAKLVLDAGNRVIYRDDKQVDELHLHLTRRASENGSEILMWRR